MNLNEATNKYFAIGMDCAQIKANKDFTVVFCGVFSSGKSSLINCLLDYPFFKLPTGINPITKLVTHIRYGEKLAFYYYENDRKIGVSENDFRAIVKGEKSLPEMNHEIYIDIPSALLKNGIVFLDTPGFEDEMGGTLEQISREAVFHSDFVVFCTNAQKVGDMFEKEYLGELEESVGNYCMIVNHIDSLNTKDDLITVGERASYLMQKRSVYVAEIMGKNMFFTSAAEEKQQLDGLGFSMARLFCDESIKKYIKETTAEKVCMYRYTKLAEELRLDVMEMQEQLSEMQNKHDKLIKRHQEEANERRFAAKAKKDSIYTSGRTKLAAATDKAVDDIRDLEARGIHQGFSTEVTIILRRYYLPVAQSLDSKIGPLSNNFRFHSYFKDLIDNLNIPLPKGRKVKTRGFLERFFNTASDLVNYGIFDVDDGCDMIYEGYAAPAIRVVRMELMESFHSAFEYYLEEWYHKEIEEKEFSTGLEKEIEALFDTTKHFSNLIGYCKGKTGEDDADLSAVAGLAATLHHVQQSSFEHLNMDWTAD